MIVHINGKYANKYQELMIKSFNFRHKYFVETKKWMELEKPDRCETDEFDHEKAHHILYVIDDQVRGYARLTPMSAATLLADLHSFLVTEKLNLRSQNYLEWTRFCVDDDWTAENPTHHVGARLIAAMFEFGFENRFTHILGEGNPNWVPKLKRLGLNIEPIGFPHFFDEEPTIAMKMVVNEESARRTKVVARIKGRCIICTSNEPLAISA